MAHFHFRATTARRSSAEAEAEESGRDSQRGRGGIKGRRTRSRVRAFLGLCFSSNSNSSSNRNRNSSKNNNNNNGSGSSSDDDENEKLPNARATTTAAATATATARFRPLRYRSTTTTTRLRPPPPPAATQQQQQQQQQQPQPQQQQLFEPHPGLQLLQPPAVPASAPAIADAQDSTPQYLPPIRQTTPISLSGTTIQAKPPLRKPWKHLPRPTLRKHHTYSPTHHNHNHNHNHSHSHTRHPHRSSLKSKLPLLSFPPEIILLIASHLDTDDQHALLLSSRALAALVTPLFQYSAMAAQGFNPALDFPPLHWAAWKGHTPLVRQLLDQGHDANARTLVHGTTPLHHAARWGHEGVVRVLLQQGAADVNAQDTFDGKTPLHLARLEGRVEVCNVLVAAGASVAVRDDAGRTPMAYMGGNSCEDYHWRPRGGGDGRGRAPAGERVFGREGGAGY